jgi:hypothetical protein
MTNNGGEDIKLIVVCFFTPKIIMQQHPMSFLVWLLCSMLLSDGVAFSVNKIACAKHSVSLAAKQECHDDWSSHERRNLLLSATMVLVPVATTILAPMEASAAGTAEAKALIADLEVTRSKLDAIPGLLQAAEWEKVRTILKTPPVNLLWNMGDSKNPMLQLAKSLDEFELIDYKDEISLSLQMTDQYTYDNVFVYFQPGNGKVKVKEPTEMVLKAMKQIDDALQLAKKAL